MFWNFLLRLVAGIKICICCLLFRKYSPFFLIAILGFVSACLLYGWPGEKHHLPYSFDKAITVSNTWEFSGPLARAFNFPFSISTNVFHINYHFEPSWCSGEYFPKYTLRFSVKTASDFYSFAKSALAAEHACSLDKYKGSWAWLPYESDSPYADFCFGGDERNSTSFLYPSDVQISYAAIPLGTSDLYGTSSDKCILDQAASSSVLGQAIDIFVTPSLVVWCIDWLAVSILFLFIYSSWITVRDRNK